MRFPWSRRSEERSYTDALITLIASRSEANTTDAVPGLTAAATAASTLWGRCFAAADVEPGEDSTGLSACVMEAIGRNMVEEGESVWLIEVMGDPPKVMLTQASDWDITGTGPESNWYYRVHLAAPDGPRYITVPSEGIFHPRINVTPSQPHKGRSPLVMAGYTASLLAETERSIKEEVAAPSGYTLPAPLDNLGSKATDALREELRLIRGRVRLVPSMAKGWGEGGSNNTADWKQQRIGADPPQSLAALREKSAIEIMAACGVPPVVFSSMGQAQAAREGFRQFIFSTIMPASEVVLDEVHKKIDEDVEFDFSPLSAADLQARARSFKSLVDGGMALETAAGASGILLDEEDLAMARELQEQAQARAQQNQNQNQPPNGNGNGNEPPDDAAGAGT